MAKVKRIKALLFFFWDTNFESQEKSVNLQCNNNGVIMQAVQANAQQPAQQRPGKQNSAEFTVESRRQHVSIYSEHLLLRSSRLAIG